ncbi:MAG: leucyl aminopeptidase family protein [Pseudomonadota bacterium]
MGVSDCIQPENRRGDAIPVHCLDPSDLPAFIKKLSRTHQNTVTAASFKAQAGMHLCLASERGTDMVLFGLGEEGSAERTPFLPGKLASLLADGRYFFATKPDDARLAALSFVLERYRFNRYRPKAKTNTSILTYGGKDECGEILQLAEATCLARDLINTPANDMGPQELSDAVRTVAKKFGATCKTIGGKILEKDFPLIHAVGKGSDRAPCLIDMTWGKPSHPKVTLVGKGVVFDTGGLDIKPSSNMILMKKDMGGAACTLALAQLIMSAKLPVRLRLLIPAAENSISGNSFRPSDVVTSRKGISVEVGNTDAEGRLVLADALTYASEEKPGLVIDMATLTGAARVALGPDLPPYFTDDDKLARDIDAAAAQQHDPLWRLPLYRRYASSLKSKTAELSNVGTSSFAGAIIAALFLAEFVDAPSWLHVDVYGWNPSHLPGRPEGGEAQAVRTLFAVLQKRYRK